MQTQSVFCLDFKNFEVIAQQKYIFKRELASSNFIKYIYEIQRCQSLNSPWKLNSKYFTKFVKYRQSYYQFQYCPFVINIIFRNIRLMVILQLYKFFYGSNFQVKQNPFQCYPISIIYDNNFYSPVFIFGGSDPNQEEKAAKSEGIIMEEPSRIQQDRVQIHCVSKALQAQQKKIEFPFHEKKFRKSKQTGGKKKNDEEFKPHISQHRTKRKNPQNINRNVAPNIIHQILSFLQKKSKSQKLIEKLIDKSQGVNETHLRRFYLYQIFIRDKMHHYVNVESLQIFTTLQDPQCEFYSKEEQELFLKFSRILISYFLKQEFQCIILTSKRVNSSKKLDHLNYRRMILQQLKQMFKL